MSLLPIHITAGAIAILAGSVALYAAKGAKLHRDSGMIFVYSMLVMSASAIPIALGGGNAATALQGLLTFYLVTTALLTVRRNIPQSINVAAMLVALTIGITHISFGIRAANSPTGKLFSYPPALYFIFGPLALMAAIGDIRVLMGRTLQGASRIRRHLWRMTFGMFIATGSFFLGQAKVIPKPIRIMPLLMIAALLPLVLMAYWLIRVRRSRTTLNAVHTTS